MTDRSRLTTDQLTDRLAARFVLRLVQRRQHGDLDQCSHLDRAGSGELRVWVPALAPRLLCTGCFTTAHEVFRTLLHAGETVVYCELCRSGAPRPRAVSHGQVQLVALVCDDCTRGSQATGSGR